MNGLWAWLSWFWSQVVAEFPIWLTYVVGITAALELVRWWRQRRWRDWTVVVVRPDGQAGEPMRLAPDEVRLLEQSDLERVRWIKSLISNFGRLKDMTPREILDASWLEVDRNARRYMLHLGDAVAAGRVDLHGGDPALQEQHPRGRAMLQQEGQT